MGLFILQKRFLAQTIRSEIYSWEDDTAVRLSVYRRQKYFIEMSRQMRLGFT